MTANCSLKNHFTVVILSTWSFAGTRPACDPQRGGLRAALSVLLNKLILPPWSALPLYFPSTQFKPCVCLHDSVCPMCMCASSVGVNNVHNIVAIPNVLVSHLGLPWGVCRYPRTYSWCGFNKHCRCEAIESLQDCSQWQFHVPHRVQMSSANITGALNLCLWQREGSGSNGHRLQVADVIVVRGRQFKRKCNLQLRSLSLDRWCTKSFLLFNYKKSIAKQKALLLFMYCNALQHIHKSLQRPRWGTG